MKTEYTKSDGYDIIKVTSRTSRLGVLVVNDRKAVFNKLEASYSKYLK